MRGRVSLARAAFRSARKSDIPSSRAITPAVHQERRGLDAERGVNDGREAIDPVMAVAREAADARAVPAHHQPVTVMLDFVDPEPAGRGRATLDGWHGSMKPEGRRRWTIRLAQGVPPDPVATIRPRPPTRSRVRK